MSWIMKMKVWVNSRKLWWKKMQRKTRKIRRKTVKRMSGCHVPGTPFSRGRNSFQKAHAVMRGPCPMSLFSASKIKYRGSFLVYGGHSTSLSTGFLQEKEEKLKKATTFRPSEYFRQFHKISGERLSNCSLLF